MEVHIHHDRETVAGFMQKMSAYCRRLRDDHGLQHDHNGRPVFGFIHGNWALGYTRGARQDNADALLETGSKAGGLAQMFQWLHDAAAERPVELHWAGAYEMFCAVEALTHGSRAATAQGVPAATGAEAR